MLCELHIENIAVIERADIEFTGGLNILTGETGAGKSIVIDAISAVLGARASRELVRSGEEKGVVSAVFTCDNAALWCADNDIDTEDGQLVLTRRIAADGKSGCRVNGAPVSAVQLRELGQLLLDIHGQNDGRQLMDESRHRDYLDRFSVLDGPLEKYAAVYDRYREVCREIELLNMDEAEKERLTERLRDTIRELEDARLIPGEQDQLESKAQLLKNAGKYTEALESAYAALYGADVSAVALVGEAVQFIRRAFDCGEEMEKAAQTAADAMYELEDAAERVRDFLGTLDFSPEEYDRIETRLSLLRKLSRRYSADERGLIELLEQSRARLDEIEYAGDRLVKLERELEKAKEEARQAAKELSALRERGARRLEKSIVAQLRELNMPSVRFRAEITPVSGEPGFTRYGCDEVRFLMSANAGEEPGRISKIASGGELSRIMLAMKNVFAENDAVPAMVFDEIDSGVSGVAAQRVGEKLGNLSRSKQVICVTHLPQIAAMADTHFVIEKAEKNARTYTSVTELDRNGRRHELARLHGGDVVTQTTLDSAEEQLAAAENYKLSFTNSQ